MRSTRSRAGPDFRHGRRQLQQCHRCGSAGAGGGASRPPRGRLPRRDHDRARVERARASRHQDSARGDRQPAPASGGMEIARTRVAADHRAAVPARLHLEDASSAPPWSPSQGRTQARSRPLTPGRPLPPRRQHTQPGGRWRDCPDCARRGLPACDPLTASAAVGGVDSALNANKTLLAPTPLICFIAATALRAGCSRTTRVETGRARKLSDADAHALLLESPDTWRPGAYVPISSCVSWYQRNPAFGRLRFPHVIGLRKGGRCATARRNEQASSSRGYRQSSPSPAVHSVAHAGVASPSGGHLLYGTAGSLSSAWTFLAWRLYGRLSLPLHSVNSFETYSRRASFSDPLCSVSLMCCPRQRRLLHS